ncbi:aspartate/glutamate racemase family protein [Streptomyces heilongjiangensis]|uniref:Aspartate/glutamate racemase family protein n=1 Tax=Streptomyces heilongjiangensis TaxID=945052 RepID=A0ABW1BFL8_9ACTN|nr:amino acid racemase [Streptomyces heilongjiangensis]MDC2950193.1 amino acid racemase [Streptomyces heilongjiangensis]
MTESDLPTGRIGLIGGMSWPSTLTYYRELNRRVAAELGGSHSAHLVVWSADYHFVEQAQLNGDWREAGRLVGEAAAALQAAGADFLAMACNTMHAVADAIPRYSSLPFVSLVDATVDALDGRTRVALLGTSTTTSMPAFADAFAAGGIAVVDPGAGAQRELDRIIYSELCLGHVVPESGQWLRGLGEELTAQGAEAVILACTELNLLVDTGEPAPLPWLDTTVAHIDAIARAALRHGTES